MESRLVAICSEYGKLYLCQKDLDEELAHAVYRFLVMMQTGINQESEVESEFE